MNIVLFTHSNLLGSQSMPKYSQMIAEGMEKRNHRIEVWTPQAYFCKLSSVPLLKKWLGYVDQFLLFPLKVKLKLKTCPTDTLFVFCDHALGPWLPLVSNRPLVVHCHDFMAQRSALGEIQENKVSLTGRLYQKYIRRGYCQGKNFISISEKTQFDLHRFLNFTPNLSKIVYNGFNQDFRPADKNEARQNLEAEVGIKLKSGFLLHVGGNQFYKNRKGVVKIYDAWRKITTTHALPLLMIGAKPSKDLIAEKDNSPFSQNIYFLTNISDELLKTAYQGATVLIFPSLEEGFGWPIAEAMASGCPVITINKPPMNEVGRDNCFYLPPLPAGEEDQKAWIQKAGYLVEKVVNLSEEEREEIIGSALKNVERFSTENAIGEIELIYKSILEEKIA